MGHALRLTDRSFEREVIESDVPVLVDFWASWCPPCKMVEPVVDELAVEYEGRLKVGKLNVDRNPMTADRYQITGVPTFFLFQAGRVLQRRTGAQSKGQLLQMLDEVFGQGSRQMEASERSSPAILAQPAPRTKGGAGNPTQT